ncbi:divergent PAP2 family protein [Priestia koreensis]|uniref:divergent PAP2 family protein n=1 Tax=Priestia koreensis TaxID=284581 RepID=UPI001F57D635|nr:divergent PAP2 family protein [Priestia koreensis]MCM3003351.1 divergent PAP2 family protein [Priestia koreensis]UNL86149.1 divergent PAP2 family protein [Priestia koreensis]
MNNGILIGLSSITIAQLLKIPIKKQQTGKWIWSEAIATGGMPSSHSAGVSSLATYTALKKGVSSIEFALATIFGSIVMYDAQGIRRQTGEITIKVNTLDEEIERLAGEPDHGVHDLTEQRLKEMLGHQPAEVLAGALLGIGIGALGYFLED